MKFDKFITRMKKSSFSITYEYKAAHSRSTNPIVLIIFDNNSLNKL